MVHENANPHLEQELSVLLSLRSPLFAAQIEVGHYGGAYQRRTEYAVRLDLNDRTLFPGRSSAGDSEVPVLGFV